MGRRQGSRENSRSGGKENHVEKWQGGLVMMLTVPLKVLGKKTHDGIPSSAKVQIGANSLKEMTFFGREADVIE